MKQSHIVQYVEVISSHIYLFILTWMQYATERRQSGFSNFSFIFYWLH